MRKEDELKIDVLSGIDDRFIDKISAKRYSLLNRKKMPKWIIPSSAAAILVAIMIPVLLTLLIKQVPIYEGMTVLENYNGTSSASIEPERRENGFDFLSDKKDNNGNNGDNGNHYGQNKKPVDEIIEDDPSITLEIPDQKMYYAEPNQDIYINVHISNPDSFEILSFTLNGKKYSSYMFEDGSDMENLILKVNVGDAKGVIEYTIDAIKYVDGTDIKDVIMEGDRTIKVGVYSAGIQPNISTSNEFIGINDVSFAVDLADKFALIERCGGKAYAFICDDESVLGSKPVELGENKIEFKNLKTGTTYRYGVFAYYDALDGKGMKKHILFEKEFTTKTVVAIGNPAIEQESISFNVVFNEPFESKKLSAMTLYLGENKVEEVDVSGDVAKKTFALTKLLSNNEYRLVIAYENLGRTETVEYTFKTLEKATPNLTITETEKTQTSFKFDITVTDVDKVGAITKIELIHGENVTNVEDLGTREFAKLLSNNDYTVKVTYTYDLNDGVGNQTLVRELTVKTEAKAEPTFTIKDVKSTTYTISGSYDQSNIDNTLVSYTVKLFKGDELIKENADKKIAFNSLEDYTVYTVKIAYAFDVNDGKGEQTKIAEQRVKTLPNIDVDSAMIMNKKDIYFDGDSATLRINVDIPSGVSVKSVIIGGKTYEASDSSTSRMILVDISDVGSLGNAVIEGFVVSADGVDHTINEITQTTIDIRVISKPVITSWELVDEHFDPLEYVAKGQKAYILISAEKLENNTITGVYLGFPYGEPPDEWQGPRFHDNDIKTLDDGRFYVELGENDPVYFDSISVMYSNSYIEKDYTTNDQYDQPPCIKLESNEVRYISTPEEFVTMENGYRYELTCDLDFSTFERHSRNYFYGIIDGKGHSIKNYLIIQHGVNEGGGNAGMFWELSGIMQNINFVGFTYTEMFSNSISNTESYNTATGVIGHLCDNGIIRNCVLDETSELVTTNTINIGSICGRNDGIIENCSSYAKISSSANRQGGICAVNGGVIDNCRNYTTFTIDFAMTVGGICAWNEGVVENCVNYSDIISGVHGLVGLAGICGGSDGKIADCTNNGNISNVGSVESGAGICVFSSSTIVGCTNNGDITGFLRACGISGEGAVQSCINNGDIMGKARDYNENNYAEAAGISLNGSEVNCTNNGTVTVQLYEGSSE